MRDDWMREAETIRALPNDKTNAVSLEI